MERPLYRTHGILETTTLRIIAGSLRTRRIQFRVDPRTRPMKDRTREALMSLLGSTFDETIAFDLFGGTGVLAFETISRGADAGVIFDILKPACREILANAETLGIRDRTHVLQTDVLHWSDDIESNLVSLALNAERSWVVFCCPPYELWESEGIRIRDMMAKWVRLAPEGSLFAVELAVTTPTSFLPDLIEWDVRVYKPALIATAEKVGSTNGH